MKKTSTSTNEEKISIIEEPDGNYIWKKGKLLDLKVKIINESNSKVTVVKPSSDPNFQPGKYYASIENEFNGTSCISEVLYDQRPVKYYASNFDFITIEANSEESFDFSNELLNYCGRNSENSKTACVKIKMYAHKAKYDINSEFIIRHYSNYTLEDKNEIIDLYNSLHTKDIESNVICVQVE